MRLVDLVQAAIDGFLASRRQQLEQITPELAPFTDFAAALLTGGKRFRATFCYWGWEAVTRESDSFGSDIDAVVQVAAALEFFHAAALVHDDIIDNSDLRRGGPSSHRRFERLHVESGWDGDGAAFGRSSAILLGDLLLGWSDELFDDGINRLGNRDAALLARREFNRMRTEVMAGQYLDIREEHSWRGSGEDGVLDRAHRVIVYKSAKYSVEAPLAIGALLGNGSLEQLEALRDFGLPVGVAFQLRDDVLGVFGNPEQTGKPSGDDLREGKRTVLVAIARRRLPATLARLLDELLGDNELDTEQIRTLQASIKQSGALDDVEHLIEQNVAHAREALDGAEITDVARGQLSRLADSVTRRTV